MWFINSGDEVTPERWGKACSVLGKILGFDPTDNDVSAYLSYKAKQVVDNDTESSPNTINHEGIKVQLSTIHGVKGETHDATLVLETKNFNHDLQAMLEYLTKSEPSAEHPNSSLKENPTNAKKIEKMANQKFMRQLYVALSRPKHLLCFAIHQGRITKGQMDKLTNLGWNIVVLKDKVS